MSKANQDFQKFSKASFAMLAEQADDASQTTQALMEKYAMSNASPLHFGAARKRSGQPRWAAEVAAAAETTIALSQANGAPLTFSTLAQQADDAVHAASQPCSHIVAPYFT